MMLFTTIFLVSLMTSLAHAIPFVVREVYNPPITSPSAQTIWVVGSTETVTWDTSNLPPASQLTSPFGMIVLGQLTADSENLMLNSPLASNVSLSDGKAQITVPSVPNANNYIIVLFGDSGNASPEFTIADGSSVAPASTSAGQNIGPASISPTPSPPITTAPFPSSITTAPITTATTPPASSLSTFSSTTTPTTSSSISTSPSPSSSSVNGAHEMSSLPVKYLLGLLSTLLVVLL